MKVGICVGTAGLRCGDVLAPYFGSKYGSRRSSCGRGT